MSSQYTVDDLIVSYFDSNIENIKVGIIFKGIMGVNPPHIISLLYSHRISNPDTKIPEQLYIASVGYSDSPVSYKGIVVSHDIEKAVLWRSNPDCAGKIIVFIKEDSDKLHSLAEFDLVSSRDVSKHLIELQISRSSKNIPTSNFWKALLKTSEYYTLSALESFVNAVESAENQYNAIPQNMWMLTLLRDNDILSAKVKVEDRLALNRGRIIDIGQLGDESRKRLSGALVRSKADKKEELQQAYKKLQDFYKYGDPKTLSDLDLNIVEELFAASRKKNDVKATGEDSTDNGNQGSSDEKSSGPIQGRDLIPYVTDIIVDGGEDDLSNVDDLCDNIEKHFNPEDSENDSDDEITPSEDLFGGRKIVVISSKSDLRKIVGRYCNDTAWGGVLETEESVLKDALSDNDYEAKIFDPCSTTSPVISISGGIDGIQSLFDFMSQYDILSQKYDSYEPLVPLLEKLQLHRTQLLKSIDMIMYYPEMFFGVNNANIQLLVNYIDDWNELYQALNNNYFKMLEYSNEGTRRVLKSIVLLDTLYVRTPSELKGVLLPMHPFYLWRFYEVFKSLPAARGTMSQEDRIALKDVLCNLPQVLTFIVANGLITESNENRVLPNSGTIEMLPTFENKTNRYLGNDGSDSIEEILSRWIGFAPYTRNEVRICSVDAPDMIKILKQIKAFMSKNLVRRVVYDVYLTRNQNGNTELAKLDYDGADYEIGEYMKSGQISISIKNIGSITSVKDALNSRPVHVAFLFDQSDYEIKYGPNTDNLYINPLVITYDYDFDQILHKGCIYPSTETSSGIIGSYNNILKYAEMVTNNMSPRTTYNGNSDLSTVNSLIHDGCVQWLVVADRDNNNYQPSNAIPIGEKQYDKRTVNVWASDNSRIIDQYMRLLKSYNLYPKKEVLIDILRHFGHIASTGLISIPKFGADTQAIENKKKGLLGTLFAASWYMQQHKDALVASLDNEKARLWLKVQDNERDRDETRADLVGMYYEMNEGCKRGILHIQPIEIKTRDESADATVKRDNQTQSDIISGHAADQIASVIVRLDEIFSMDESNAANMFASARREVFKYQIVSECFRTVHDSDWQVRWSSLMKQMFIKSDDRPFDIELSGILLHVKLNETGDEKYTPCRYDGVDGFNCKIDFWELTAKVIQQDIFGDKSPVVEFGAVDYDNTTQPDQFSESQDDAFIDTDIVNEPESDEKKSSNEVKQVAEVEPKSEDNQNKKVYDFPSRPTHSIIDEFEPGDIAAVYPLKAGKKVATVSKTEINELTNSFKKSCKGYHISLEECNAADAIVGPSVIRLRFKLIHGQTLQSLSVRLDDIGREMRRTGIIVQPIYNSDELYLDIPRLTKEPVLYRDIVSKLPSTSSLEQLHFPVGRTPNGDDIFDDLASIPHLLVGGSTGSGKSVFLSTLLVSLLLGHRGKDDMKLIVSSSKPEDFMYFDKIPQLVNGGIISDASEATDVIKDTLYAEVENRRRIFSESRVRDIVEYNSKSREKMPPIVVIIDEFADLSDQFDSKKDKEAFYKPVIQIATTGRNRGIHLVLCTQRPDAKLVPNSIKSQLNGRVGLRVNDGISSRMILETGDAQYLQKHGDMIYRNSDNKYEHAQGYFISNDEIKDYVDAILEYNHML